MPNIVAILGSDQIVRLQRDGVNIAYIRPEDGEIMLNKEVSKTLTDDEWLFVLKIGRKPAIFYGENNIFVKGKGAHP